MIINSCAECDMVVALIEDEDNNGMIVNSQAECELEAALIEDQVNNGIIINRRGIPAGGGPDQGRVQYWNDYQQPR